MSKKNTKRALLSSVLALVLCLSMLIGTTFAWFTDSVTSGVNKIVAGNLDVEVYYGNPDDKNSIEDVETLFNDVTLWEPGAVAWENLTVVNEGTLALKYELAINFTNENTVNTDGKDYGLSDVLKVAVVPGGVTKTTREEVLAEAGEGTLLSDFIDGGYLTAGGSTTYGVVIYWEQSENDNNWNVNNGKKTSDGRPLHIDLGVALTAYQKDYEKDSFGDDYDAGLGTSYVSTYAEFAEALKSGGNIVLKGDITATAEDALAVVPEGVTAVLDLNGYSLSSADVATKYVLNNLGTLTLKDSVGTGSVNARGIYNGYDAENNHVTTAKLTVLSGTYNAKGTNGGAAIFNYGVAEILGGEFTSVGSYALNNREGAVMTVSGNVIVTGGVYNMGDLTINNAELSQPQSGKHGVYHYGTKLEINGGTYESVSGNELIKAATGNAVINGGIFNQIGKSYIIGDAGNITINGGTFNGYVNANGSNDKMRPGISVNGGTFNFDPTDWVTSGNTVQDNGNGTWTVTPEKYTTFIADGLYSDGNVDYAVANANGLATLNTMMANKTAGKYVNVELIDDIDFAGKTWTPVDSHADTAFHLTSINGNSHTISNLTINGQAMFTRFAGFGDVLIKDLTFENAKVNSNALNTSILTVQTYQNTVLDNVDVVDSYIKGSFKVAPLIATVYNENTSTITLTVKNCDVSNTVVEATGYDFCTTGLVAFVYAGDNDKIEFENCTVSNVKLVAPYDDYQAHAFVYTTGSGSLYNEAEGVTVTDCSVEIYMDGTTTFEGGTLYLKDGTYITAAEGQNALTITSDTTLIVEGDVTLSGGKNGSGIYVAEGVELTITGDGNLNVYGNSGMEYEASGNYCEYDVPSFANAGGSGISGANATIIIDGLDALTAEGYGKGGFGIGGNGSTVTIKNTTIDSVRGGFVNVTGEYNDPSWNKSEPEGGAAIGGAVITITDSHIKEALGGSKAAGIGARYWQAVEVTITNSIIDKVVGGASSAGIGGSRISNGNTAQNTTITITDSTVTAFGGYFGAGIGSGYNTYCNVPDQAPMHTIYIKGDSVINATGGRYAAGIGTGYHVANLDGEIEESVTVNAVSGEKFYKDTYTQAQDIGFGVTDPAREGLDNTCTFKYNGVENGIPAV